MTNKKISALTSATTPLAGTEVFPLVQSSATVKTPVSAVLDQSTTEAKVKALTASGSLAALIASSTQVDIFGGVSRIFAIGANTSTAGRLKLIASSSDASVYYEGLEVKANGDVSLPANNLVPATAGKGVNFTANTPQAGMTSQLLNWYEEGIWTPNQGAGLTLVGAFSSTGKYTRIGRQVSVSGTVTGATSVAVAAAGVVTSNLPFTVGTAGHGDATNAAVNASAAVICTGTSVTSAGGLLATGTITFSATYFV